MKLKDVCERTGISKRNIHFYIKEELLNPSQDDTNGYYDFSKEDCERLMMIRSLRNAGFSIPQIRSILSKPSTAGYYLNQRLKQLHAEISHSKEVISALSYVQERLPLHVGYEQFASLIREAGIPQQEYLSESVLTFEAYDNDLVNRFLWGSFLPDAPMTDYQEYLWSKVIRYSNGSHSRDYQLLSQSLHRFTGNQIELSFAGNRELHNEVIYLSPDDYETYARQMIVKIEKLLDSPRLVTSWRSKYLNFTAPATRLYDSEIASTMAELSPLFHSYREHIHAVCRLAYDWIQSEDGKDLLAKMNQKLTPLFDIDYCSHGELQAMATELR